MNDIIRYTKVFDKSSSVNSKFLYNGELYHHGILGQKWGIRRFQNKDGSLTSEGKRRRKDSSTQSDFVEQDGGKEYLPTREDARIYGRMGAERIAERRNKGLSRRSAVRRENGRRFLKKSALILGTAGVMYLTSSGKLDDMIDKARKWMDSRYDMKVVDEKGRVVAKYRNAVSNEREITTDLMVI